MKTYPTWQEDDAYRTGYSDASMGRGADCMRTPKNFAEYDTPDRAYWDGFSEYHTRNNERLRRIEEMDQEYDEEYRKWREGL